MTPIFNDHPDDLVKLRNTVKDWLEKAAKSVITFADANKGTFKKEYKEKKPKENLSGEKDSLTVTARCYMALVCAYSCLDEKQGFEKIQKKLMTFNKKYKESKISFSESDENNNFKLAHHADLKFVENFSNQFFDDRNNIDFHKSSSFKRVINKLPNLSSANQKGISSNWEMHLIQGDSTSKHFFVTLHYLRAKAILNPEDPLDQELKNELTDEAKQFCIEQCFYNQRGLHNLLDTTRLTFASVIYILYAPYVDKELCMAVIETLAETQQKSGSWSATHPIIREGKDPWYITTHEISLCLTWLYFQPKLPDPARPILLKMMEKYFTKWVIPTYLRVGDHNGWCNDRVNGHDVVSGWATGIICHFLANYYNVLNDHINRRVIETLNLQTYSKRYLIDETLQNINYRWKIKCYDGDDDRNNKQPVWPDLPPYSWKEYNAVDIADTIRSNWTDPSIDGTLSTKLAEHVISPIIKNRLIRPKNYIAGILDGPPGTRKTSLVDTVSEILKWPLISVPASVIFEKGFDQMEAQASIVFRMLNYLTCCIIFFDEFEEFVRDRQDDCMPTHNRTIAAFTTSSMLPRLQDLRNEKQCLIFLATNHIDKIDTAIIRPGRFDYQETINHPVIKRFTEKNSYLDNLTKRTLGELNIQNDDSNNKKKEDIINAVKKALEDGNLLEKLRKSNKSLGKADETIKFNFVENSLKEVEKIYNESDGIEKRKETAIKAILNKIDTDLMTCKGPEALPPAKEKKS